MCKRGTKEMSEKEYNGTNREMNPNPEALSAGIEQPMVVLHFCYHLMPLASTKKLMK